MQGCAGQREWERKLEVCENRARARARARRRAERGVGPGLRGFATLPAMKQYKLQAFGYDGLKLVDAADPTPGPGEVLVRTGPSAQLRTTSWSRQVQ